MTLTTINSGPCPIGPRSPSKLGLSYLVQRVTIPNSWFGSPGLLMSVILLGPLYTTPVGGGGGKITPTLWKLRTRIVRLEPR